MKQKLYYDEYFMQNQITYDRGKYNVVRTPCGSGKTFHCLNVITEEYDGKYGKRYGLANHYRCLYITDTTALRESVINSYLKYTKKTKLDEHNLVVQTYSWLGRQIAKDGIDTLCDKYDYIFLDEVHQLFVYEKFDTEEEQYYGIAIDSLEDIVRSETTLICLSATPDKLLEHIQFGIGQGEILKVKDVVPLGELHKIKCYVNSYEIPVHDSSTAIREINLEDNDKLFVFAQTIRELEQLEEQCIERGWTTCSLWSIKHNRDFKYYSKLLEDDTLSISERLDLEERLEKCKPMSDYQINIRKKLINEGEYDTQVILLNAAYESGINIENGVDSEQATIHVVVSSSTNHVITQARGRIRHDIDCLWHLTNNYYDCGTGIDAHRNLTSRLEQLAEECRNNEFAFTGKQGKQRISSVLMLFNTYTYNGKTVRKRVKNVEPMNDVLMLYELPFHIEEQKCDKRVNGKRIKTYYVVVDERITDEE